MEFVLKEWGTVQGTNHLTNAEARSLKNNLSSVQGHTSLASKDSVTAGKS